MKFERSRSTSSLKISDRGNRFLTRVILRPSLNDFDCPRSEWDNTLTRVIGLGHTKSP